MSSDAVRKALEAKAKAEAAAKAGGLGAKPKAAGLAGLLPAEDLEKQRLAEIPVIRASCTSCQVCVPLCPAKAIFKGVGQFVIDTDLCTACGLCLRICPEKAIYNAKKEAEAQKALEDEAMKKTARALKAAAAGGGGKPPGAK